MTAGKSDKPRHLGRGLESLLGPITTTSVAATDRITAEKPVESPVFVPLPPDTELGDSLQVLSLDTIRPNPYQARTLWNEADLAELAESIRANGVIQPVIVRRHQGGYQLIAGERRYRAAQMVGLAGIPAVVREVTDEQLFEWSLVENIHRRDLNPIERAKAYQHYLGAFSLTQTEAAQRLGEDRSVIANYLRLLDLPDELKQMLIDGRLTMGHARAILSLPTDELRRKLANRALAGRLNVREVERLVRMHMAEQPGAKAAARTKPANIIDLETKLCRHLGTHVSIETKKHGRSGRITIEFHSIDEFERITDVLGVACTEEA